MRSGALGQNKDKAWIDTMHTLIAPYGDVLVDLMADVAIMPTLNQTAGKLPVIKLDSLMQSDLILLLTGGCSPLTGYMGQADYLSVLNHMRLGDGRAWAIPLTLAIPIRLAQSLQLGQQVALSAVSGELIAVLTVSEIYRADVELEARQLGATLEFKTEPKWYVAGAVTGLISPERHDFVELQRTPAQLREHFARHGWGRVVAYQSAQPLHRAAFEFITRAAAQNQAGLLIQPMVGGYAPERADYYPLIRGYQAVMKRLSGFTSILSLSPNYPRRGGVRDILHRAILLRNYGCSHLVVGGEPGGEGQSRRGSDVLDSQVYQQVSQHIKDIGVGLIPYPRMVYVEERAQFLPLEEAPKEAYKLTLSADEIKRRLRAELAIPEWYAFPEVLAEMRQAYPPRHRSGLTIMLTGSAGLEKTRLAQVLSQVLMAIGTRKVSVLDDALSQQYPSLASDGILGLIAVEITRHDGIAICAVPAATTAMRREIRQKVQAHGGYLECHVLAPVAAPATRAAKSGDAGVYEALEQADLIIDMSAANVAQAVQAVILKLEQEGYLP